MAVGKLKSLSVAGANALDLVWDDNHAARVELSAIIAGHQGLKPIKPAKAFAQAKLSRDRWSVEWQDGIDFGATQLRRWAAEQSGDSMPPADFRAWVTAHGMTLDEAAAALGLSRRMVAYYLSGEKQIPRTVMLAIEGLWGMRGYKPWSTIPSEAVVAKFHDQSVQLLHSSEFDLTRASSPVLLALYISLIEYVGTMLVLTRKRARTGFSSVFRSYLECLVDFSNLLSDDTYFLELEGRDNKEWLAVLRDAEAGNPFLAGIVSSESFQSQYATRKSSFDSLRKKGFGKMTRLEAFTKANMQNEYRSVYNFECAEAHNNIRALEKRHVDVVREGVHRLMIYGSEDDTYFGVRLAQSGYFLVGAGVELHENFQTGCSDTLRDLAKLYPANEVFPET